MHNKTIISFLRFFVCLALVIILPEGISFAANAGGTYQDTLQHFVGSGKLPPGLIEKDLGDREGRDTPCTGRQ